MKQNRLLSPDRRVLMILMLVLFVPFTGQAANKPVTVTAEEAMFSATLQKREQIVVEKEKSLQLQQEQLTILQKDVDAKLAEISVIQKDVSEKLAELKQVQDAEFKNLIKVFSTMSASKVAPLLNEMNDRNVARILRAMKNDLVAKIIPKLEPAKAVRVSRILGRIDATL